MKRCVCVLVCTLMLAWASVARADGPNLRQSVTYFMNFINECIVQDVNITNILEKEKKQSDFPYTAKTVFYTDLKHRVELAMNLSLNLCDIYHIYQKTTYCFTKDEKTYLFDRIDNILKVFQQLIDNPYPQDKNIADADKAQMEQMRAAFGERLRKLRLLIRSSLPAFNR